VIMKTAPTHAGEPSPAVPVFYSWETASSLVVPSILQVAIAPEPPVAGKLPTDTRLELV
jgi:hypothetical protein